MIKLRNSPYQSSAEFLSNAIEIAEFYGFRSLEEMPKGSAPKRTLPPGARKDSDILFARRDERLLPSAARRLLASQDEEYSPIFAWRIMPSPTNTPSLSFELHVTSVPTAIAEALLIATAHAIMAQLTSGERTLLINNLGSSESFSRYMRDVGTYLRKHIDSIAPALRPRAANDPVGTLVQLIERGHPAISRAPQAMEYLGEEERRRFWELLEFLEISGIAYELNPHVLGSQDCWSQALFEMVTFDQETGERETLAQGGRYDRLYSRLARSPRHAVMITMQIETKGATTPKRLVQGVPAIYFAHLGIEARRKSLRLLENLRNAGIPVRHGLVHERIGEQMTAARTLGAPYILIMGHKEAVEDSIMVREIATNSQETVPLSELTGYLRKRRLGLSTAKMHA